MNKMKSAALFAASVTGLVLSAASFAADTSAYDEAVSAAKADYNSAVAACNDRKSDQRSKCVKDAQANEKIALSKAQNLREDGKSTAGKAPSAAPGAMMGNGGSARPMDPSAPASEPATEGKPADKATQ